MFVARSERNPRRDGDCGRAIVVGPAQGANRRRRPRSSEFLAVDRQFGLDESLGAGADSLRLPLGSMAAEAEDWMRRWLASSSSQLRACAAVTLPALSPTQYPVVESVAGVLSGLTAGDIRMVLNPYRVTKTRDTMGRSWPLGLAIGMSPLLDPGAAGDQRAWRNDRELAYVDGTKCGGRRVGDVVEVLGPKAAPLVSPLAKSFASMDPRSLGSKTAMVLARLVWLRPGQFQI